MQTTSFVARCDISAVGVQRVGIAFIYASSTLLSQEIVSGPFSPSWQQGVAVDAYVFCFAYACMLVCRGLCNRLRAAIAQWRSHVRSVAARKSHEAKHSSKFVDSWQIHKMIDCYDLSASAHDHWHHLWHVFHCC
jgi:hypothetical protein